MKAERFFSGRSLENMGNKWDELGYIYIWCTISVSIILYMLYYITWEVVFCFLIIIICYGLEMVLWRWNNIIIILNSHEQGFIDGVWFVWCYMAYVVDLNGVVISTNSHLNRIKWGYIYIHTTIGDYALQWWCTGIWGISIEHGGLGIWGMGSIVGMTCRARSCMANFIGNMIIKDQLGKAVCSLVIGIR